MKKQRYAIALCMVMLLLSAGCVHALGEGTPMVYRSELETQNLQGKISISERWTSQSTQARAFSSLPLAGFLKADSTVPGKPAEDQSSVTIRGQKKLTGRKLKDGEFTFVLKDADGNVLEETQNRGSSFAFSPIVPTSAGDAVYTVSEKNASLGGIEYDSTVYTVRIHAEENSSGEIICTSAAEPAGAIVFSNSYYAHGIAELTGVQQLMGRTREADLFSYSVKEGDATVAAGKANSDGIIEFSRIDYDLKDVGEHTYTVSLDEMELPGYTLDDTVYTVTVNVQDNADGTLQTVVTGDGSQMVFTNVYSATDSLPLEGRSVFEDEEEAKAYLGSGSLPASAFTLSEVLDGQEQVIQTVQSSREDGSIRFADLQYTQDDAGEHTYVIRQAEVDSDVLSMDGSEYTVSVGVQDNGDGTLTLTKETWLDGETAEEILFTNAVNHTCLTIQNWVTGDISDYAFRFTVLLYMNGEEMTVPFDYYGSKEGRITSGDTIELKSGENVTIGNMPEGVHYRVVEEECPRYRVIVNGQDTLVSEGEALGEEGAMLEFTNSMISTTFTVYKQWVGVQGGKIRLVMYADGIEMVPQPSVTWSGNSNTYTVDGLPKYTYGGRRIIYTAKEAYMSGYMTDYRNLEGLKADCAYDGCTIVNTAVKQMRVRSVFSGVDPKESLPSVGLTVYRTNGTEYKHVDVKTDKNGWLNIYNLPLGSDYYVVQDSMEGFKTTYANDENGSHAEDTERVYENGTITNHKIAKTGDNRPVELWVAVMMASLVAMTIIVFDKKRVKSN